jgi:AcrR family transcriptional regulator
MARRNLRNVDDRILCRTIVEGAENGVQGISTKKIASALRISEPTIYIHFKTKDNLINAAYQKAFSVVYGCVNIALNGVLEETLEKNVELILKNADEHRNEVIFVFHYQHLDTFKFANPPDSEAGKSLLAVVEKIWHHDSGEKTEFCPYIERQIYCFVTDVICLFSYKVALNELSADSSSAKFVYAILMSGLSGGKERFLSSLSDDEKETLSKKHCD